MTISKSKESTDVLLARGQDNAEWLEVTPGERFTIRTTIAQTQGAYTMLEEVAEPRNGVPMHIHKNEDEHFIVVEGTCHIANGNERSDHAAGKAVKGKKGVEYGWCNRSDTMLRMLVVFSPGHIEGLFRANPLRRDDDLAALIERFGVVMVGPALFEDIYTIRSPRPAAA